MWSISAQIALGIAVALSPCYWIYVALRCALGFVCVSIVFCGFVLSKSRIAREICEIKAFQKMKIAGGGIVLTKFLVFDFYNSLTPSFTLIWDLIT